MDRRRAALALSGLGIGVMSGCDLFDNPSTSQSQQNPVFGDQTCNVGGAIAPTASVNIAAFYQTAAQFQLLDMWCWAACVSMIFTYRGHPVRQDEIVSRVYGGVVNFPAIGLTVASALNIGWTDDNGRSFQSRVTGLYDSQTGIVALNNDQIVNSLVSGTPLVIGANSHARVLTEVNYQPSPFGTGIVGGQVFDPASGALECLSPFEMTPTNLGGSLAFLASVSVS